MGKMKVLLTAAMVLGLTLALAGMASAATIQCGECHGAGVNQPLPVNADNCDNDARGLHGTHANYSSAAFPKTVASNGKCSYCHTATASKAPSATHNNNYTNITGNASPKAPGLDYNAGTSTCTNACHKNEGATAKWGNYTAIAVGGVKLNCGSCHDDSASASIDLSGAHAIHLGTGIATGTALDGAGNAKCAACHPDNTGDLWSGGIADDGTKKAYPHASDGTNVVSANATVNAGWGGTSCTAACHTNSTADAWSATELSCTSCHADTATAALLSGAHNKHITAGKVCTDCHTVPAAGDTAHVSVLPLVAGNATITRANMTFNDGANPSCTFAVGGGVGCHGDNTTPDWYQTGTGCATCHNYPGAGAISKDWTAVGNGHLVRYDAPVANTHLTATGYTYQTDDKNVVMPDTSKCGKCHGGVATHNDGTVNVTGVGKGNGNCATDFTITKNGPNDVTCGNVKCHSGKTTPNWWE